MSFIFNEVTQKQFDYLLPRYPHKKALVLPCLWMVQYQEGYISSDAMSYISEILDVPKRHIYGVATFYTLFKLEKVAPYHIQVCRTLSCDLCGKNELVKSIEEETGLKVDEENELFRVSEVECLGACGGAPAISLNEEYHENLNASSIKELLQRLKNDS